MNAWQDRFVTTQLTLPFLPKPINCGTIAADPKPMNAGVIMNFWLDLFTGTTWQEFQKAGAKVTGFREHNRKRAQGIKRGDIFLCYLTGVKRWVGLLEVTGDQYRDDAKIWGEEVFPIRFPVKPLAGNLGVRRLFAAFR